VITGRSLDDPARGLPDEAVLDGVISTSTTLADEAERQQQPVTSAIRARRH
jgi:hypothetical protein